MGMPYMCICHCRRFGLRICVNQRERDRERAQARAKHQPGAGRKDDLMPEQRRERDAKALQEKLAKKVAQATLGGDLSKLSVKKK
ncbi:hypothetical protein KP509_02G097200 [Ceratopteris richardii]|uniref:Small EDRK-rich factor-like N-terminal domain-containing protein n=1 Tax=Ceratopteris richardii TaxID=49495 RepID=A0A8T2VFX8_CERRI|nr:hypothetical protein KP509_02G097200 [Ceratopteris richardii]